MQCRATTGVLILMISFIILIDATAFAMFATVAYLPKQKFDKMKKKKDSRKFRTKKWDDLSGSWIWAAEYMVIIYTIPGHLT